MLGLPPGEGEAEVAPPEVRRAFRRRAALVHPDKCRLPGAEAAFKLLAVAASHTLAHSGCDPILNPGFRVGF